ncbi:MAG: AI-2E family transporter [Candidatus Krumholzibacteriales bacterium]
MSRISAEEDNSSKITNQEIRKASRYALILLLLLSLALFISIIRTFLVSIVIAATFVTLFYPLYGRIVRAMRGRRGAASILTCLLLMLCVFLPLSLVVAEVARQAVDLYQNAAPWLSDLLEKGDTGLIGKIQNLRIYQWLDLGSVNWQKVARDVAGKTGSVVASVVNTTSRSLFDLVTSLFVVLFTMFYLFRDGKEFLHKIRHLSPLKDEYEKMIYERFVEISRATVRGTAGIGLIQGFSGAVVLMLFGFKSWLLFGVIMTVLSIIPFVGAWVVMLPAGLIKLIAGDIWQGVVIILISVLLISMVDNILRPRLVGRESRMHDLIIFFSTLGGISVFGVAGFIAGPVIAAFFLSMIDIWSREYGNRLKSGSSG